MAASGSRAMDRWTVETILPKLRAANAPKVSCSDFVRIFFHFFHDFVRNANGIIFFKFANQKKNTPQVLILAVIFLLCAENVDATWVLCPIALLHFFW